MKGKKIDRLMQKKERIQNSPKVAEAGDGDEESGESETKPTAKIDDQIEQLRADIVFIQDNINDCQSNIMQMEESKVAVPLSDLVTSRWWRVVIFAGVRGRAARDRGEVRQSRRSKGMYCYV